MLLINFLSLPRLLPRSSTIAHVEIYASAISGKTKKKFELEFCVTVVNEVDCHGGMVLWRFGVFASFTN
jgi:hypothetical protein